MNKKSQEKLSFKSVVQYWNDWFRKNTPKLKTRDFYIHDFNDKSLARVFLGVRRSGKTSVAAMNAMLSSKNLEKVCYLNFEDNFFVNINASSLLDKLPIIYEEIYSEKPSLIILDEIQYINSWEKWARKIIDTEAYQLFITGSSAKLLSSELATAITGRRLDTKVWPLSFQEFLDFKSIKTPEEFPKALEDYFYVGGFPKAVLEKNPERRRLILQQYLQDIVFRDIASRYEIRSINSLNSVLHYFLTNISSKHSFNSLKRAFSMSVSTAQEYAEYMESAFLFFFVKKYDLNLKVQARNPQKVYCIDTGLRQANAFYHSLDQGKIAENIVFIELLRRGHEIFYHQADHEVDFLLVENGFPQQAINVSYSNLADQELYEREVEGMLEALMAYGLDEGLILTKSLDTEEHFFNKKIRFEPVYKFLLKSIR